MSSSIMSCSGTGMNRMKGEAMSDTSTCEGCKWGFIEEGAYYSERHLCCLNDRQMIVRRELVKAYSPPQYPPACQHKESDHD